MTAPGAAPEPPEEPTPPETSEETVTDPDPGWTEPDQDWAHEWIEFQGDKLAVRKPTTQALAAYSLSASQFIDGARQNDISGMFMDRHMALGSYMRVMDRFMSPDDPDYDETTVGELMKQIVELRTNELTPDNRAARRHPDKQAP